MSSCNIEQDRDGLVALLERVDRAVSSLTELQGDIKMAIERKQDGRLRRAALDRRWSRSQAIPGWQTRSWSCRDGRSILIKDMGSQHIRNAIKMLERKGNMSARDYTAYVNSFPVGDTFAMDESIVDATPSVSIDWLVDELVRRGEQ